MKKVFDENNIESILSCLRQSASATVPMGFSAAVMGRIRSDIDTSVVDLQSVYVKFLLGASTAAAAAVMLAMNTVQIYMNEISEIGFAEFFNIYFF